MKLFHDMVIDILVRVSVGEAFSRHGNRYIGSGISRCSFSLQGNRYIGSRVRR